MAHLVSIDELIEVVRNGGSVKTGIDVYNDRDILLLEKDVLVGNINILLILKENGLVEVPLDADRGGGAWNAGGKLVQGQVHAAPPPDRRDVLSGTLHEKIQEINQLRHEAAVLQQQARTNAKKVISEAKKTGGEFDQSSVEDSVDDIFVFLTKNEYAFSYLTREIFTYDDYLYNHSVNVCTLGIAILKKYNDQFGEKVNKHLNQTLVQQDPEMKLPKNFTSFILYYPDELRQIAIGLFLHDIGKVLLPESVLNKEESLTREEFELVKTHSTELGTRMIRKNMIYNIFIENIVRYHHAALFKGDERSYPDEKLPIEIPPYVKICKLVDIYDAMTSKRCYKEAVNPIIVVTEILRRFARKDVLLQMVLHAFMQVVGIYPPGSVVYLQNGQMAYVLDSEGPICIPFTDTAGTPLAQQQEPIDLGGIEHANTPLMIDRRKPPVSPKDAYHIFPDYLKQK